MALWQIALDLVPASAATVMGMSAARMTREQLDAIEIGLTRADVTSISGSLDALLPEKESWSPDLRIWGDEKTHDIQVWFDGQRVETFQFRLDVSHLSLTLLGGICVLARQLGCSLATRDGAVIQPTREAVLRAILKSPATQFVSDPQAFLENAIRLDNSES